MSSATAKTKAKTGPVTIEMVADAIAALGFVPNPMARAWPVAAP